MIQSVLNHFKTEFPFAQGKRLGVAVSGGLDSMCLIHILLDAKVELHLVHCNFKLRGTESDQDQQFLVEFAKKHELPLQVKEFTTQEYAKRHGVSIQMAARDLRYQWFSELVQHNQLDYIATAHHANDALETFLINLSRGTGLQGLTGIPAINGTVIRPLLQVTREQLESFAQQRDIAWREDSSNASDSYLRNQIRHHLVPELIKIKPDFINQFKKTQGHLEQSNAMLAAHVEQLISKCVTPATSGYLINITTLNELAHPEGFLYQWLYPYGFTAWEDINAMASGQSGKQIFAPQWVLTKNRDELRLEPLEGHTKAAYTVDSWPEFNQLPLPIECTPVAALAPTPANQIIVDAESLEFPITLRHWEAGDYFYPFGMQGSKKLSDYFVDQKVPVRDKEKIWLLCSANRIVWVVGMRADDRFKVNKNSKSLLKFTWTI